MSNWNGLPEHPERNGWHWLKRPDCDYPTAAEWISDPNDKDPWGLGSEWWTVEMTRTNCVYLGPCLLPSEVAACEDTAWRAGRACVGEKEGERIVAVAFRLPDGLVLTLPAPARHHDIIGGVQNLAMPRAAKAELVLGEEAKPHRQVDQGFLTSAGRYVTREEAMTIARAQKQLIGDPPVPHMLFSEDVW